MQPVHTFIETYFIPAQLVLAMIGMGATLRVRDFLDVVRDFRGLLLGLALQLLWVPLLSLAFIAAFGMTKGWAVGLVLVAVAPGGALSNLLTHVGRGNVALSVSVTAVTTAICVVTIPFLLTLLVTDYVPATFRVPTWPIVRDILLFLLLPLCAGMAALRVSERAAVALVRSCIPGSLVLLVAVVASSLGSGRIRVAEYGWGPPLRLIAFGALLATVTPRLCRALGRFDEDAAALGIETTVRNMALGLLLVHFFFPGEEAQRHVLYSALFYAGTGMVSGVVLALASRSPRGPAWPFAPRRRPG